MVLPALRPLALGEILDVSFGVYRRHFGVLAPVVLACSGGPYLLGLYLQASGGLLANPLLAAVYYLAFVVLQSVATAATVLVISESYLGRALGPGEALRRAAPLAGRLLVMSLLMGSVIMAGFFLFLVPGIILACGLVLATPALVLEPGVGAAGSLRRSWALTRGSRWRIFALLLTVGVLLYVPFIGVGALAALVLPGGPPGAVAPAAVLVTLALSGVIQMFVFPLFYCVVTVAYYDLRVRREGFDLEVLASTLQPA